MLPPQLQLGGARAQQLKVLASKPSNLSSISGIHTVKRETDNCKFSSDYYAGASQ